MQLLRTACCLSTLLFAFSSAAGAQNPDIDLSASHAVYRILLSMKQGAPQSEVAARLDSVLATRPYRTMFRHYNRSWRPNHLPPDVFKRMILSLGYPEAYSAGENQRADQMLPRWQTFYHDLPRYAANLRQLDQADIKAQFDSGVRLAQSWLPREWKIPDFYLPILPQGGSSAFTIDTAQGYDFFQLPRDSAGNIQLAELRSIIAHESHHLGVQPIVPSGIRPADSIAYEFLAMFMPEGTATKFASNIPGGCAPSIDPARRDPTYASTLREWWERYTANEAELFNRFVTTFEQAYAGTLSRDSLAAQRGSYWLSGFVSPVYFVGAELYGAIYHAYGKEGAFAAMVDPRKVLPMYHDAIKKRPDLLGNCYVIPDSTLRHARLMSERR